jgi:hypothetical protein
MVDDMADGTEVRDGDTVIRTLRGNTMFRITIITVITPTRVILIPAFNLASRSTAAFQHSGAELGVNAMRL